MAKEIAEEYASSLADLTVNSKPLINMLTILAEENIEHAGVIVETVEKHLEKVPPDIKLPVLYLVDSIIKNVGGAYTTKFSQMIVNMFTKTFKQVDEKTRSQMFKLRETWHEVFPSTKMYQLDVKVNLIDPAWPIQAQPHQSNIHVNPNFLKKPAPSTGAQTEEERMRSVVAKKEQELLMLQRKKVEMELEKTRRQLQLAENSVKMPAAAPVAAVAPAVAPPVAPPDLAQALSIKQRLGPPVNKPSGRIAPVSAALASARRDPRLARRPPPASAPAPAPAPASAIAPNVFDIKPLERNVTVTKRKNVITIDVRPDQPRRRPDRTIDTYIDRIPDPKKINRLPPIPKINRDDGEHPPIKRKKELPRDRRKRRDGKDVKESSSSSPEKRQKVKKDRKMKTKERVETEEKTADTEVVAFKELKNYHKERYMRRNKEKSESPERPIEEAEPPDASTNPPEIATENKDVDLRVLHPVIAETAAPIAQKRPSTEALEGKVKKNKLEKFDILFGNEDVDLRQLPQVEEVNAPPPPSISENNSTGKDDLNEEDSEEPIGSPPIRSPRKDWQEVKEKEETKKTPSKLDLVRAKLAEATKLKDGLGRPLLFSKSPSVEKERRRTLSSDETDPRAENAEDFDAEDHKKTISIIMNQAKEQFSDGKLDKNQYNALMYQVLQLNEKLKLKEAKQRESLEISKRKLKAHIEGENKVASPKLSPSDRNTFGDIDERVTPAAFVDSGPDNQMHYQDSDMRVNHNGDHPDGFTPNMYPPPHMIPMFMGPYPPRWRGQMRPRIDEFGMRRFRAPIPPFFRGKFDKRMPRPPFDQRMPLLPTPKLGICQGESPLKPYERSISPPPLGAPGYALPPTDIKVLEYIDHDPVKTIQIDSVPREIRFYGETAVIMLDWDDPREIKFLPGSRRVTFDNKDSVVLSFNEGYKQIEIDDQTFDIRFGAPTRELYINGRWYECFFGGQPLGVIIDGKPRLIHLEGPLPQVDIGKTKRTDLVAGKINLIVNATNICPVYLDAKVQKFQVNGQFFTIRFVDSLRTVLINEQPFKVEYGDLPKPIFVGSDKYFVRFSALPKNVKPGQIEIADMEGSTPQLAIADKPEPEAGSEDNAMETKTEEIEENPVKSPSPEREMKGLDMLASLMPTSMAPASSSEYSSAEPLFAKPDKIPGLETPAEEKPPTFPIIGNINVNDLYAKLVATGIVNVLNDVKTENKNEKTEEVKAKPKEDKNIIHKVDLLKSETLRVKQPGIVARLYGGMQCSGCGARFPPEHTVRYSQHLDWHFRQNRRERDSARRAHSRHWHYDLSDWLQYEELEDLEEREKSWFETGGREESAAEAEESPSAAAGAPQHHCALCGDRFLQFYNEDREEWHLRNSVRHDAQYYHPLCLQDYKASLTKEETPKEEEQVEAKVEEGDNTVEAIEIKDDDTRVEDADESDSESVVEVVEPVEEPPEPVEIDEGDDGEEDDVVLKAEPVEQLEVEDADTDDETAAQRADRDMRAKEFANVKVKIEPVDPDDEPIITAEVESIPPTIDTTHNTVMSSIDGNVQLEEATPAPTFPLGGIRINISKTIPTFANSQDDKSLDDISLDDEPLPPGEELELEYKLKPTLEGIHFSRQPPVQKGSELSGLCSIM